MRVTVFMTPRRRACSTEVKELLTRYQALSPEDRGRVPRPGAQPGARRRRSSGSSAASARTRSSSARATGKKYVEEDKLADFDFAGAGMGGAPAIKAFKGEEAFTSAILSVTETRQPKIVLLDRPRRGLARLRASAAAGYAEAKQLLERDNVTVATWDSLGKGELPADADVVVVAGPRAAVPRSRGRGAREVPRRGRTGPVPARSGPARDRARRRPTRAWRPLSDKYGVKLGDDIVIDPANALPLVGAEVVLAEPLREPSDRAVARRPRGCR